MIHYLKDNLMLGDWHENIFGRMTLVITTLCQALNDVIIRFLFLLQESNPEDSVITRWLKINKELNSSVQLTVSDVRHVSEVRGCMT